MSGNFWIQVGNIEYKISIYRDDDHPFFVSRCLEYEREILEVFNERIPTERVVSQ